MNIITIYEKENEPGKIGIDIDESVSAKRAIMILGDTIAKIAEHAINDGKVN
jgi:hypothetical protein